MFQKYLATPSTSDAAGDRITESVIVLLGRLARHLDGQDQRGNDVLERLTQALKTPSEVVQIAVAECLPPLVRVNKERGSRLLEQLLRQTIKAPTYAERRGAAYGLAGAVKGRGLTALKEHDILEQLQEAAEDKKNVGYRQGAIFAYETLSTTLGRLFEPYIVKILPLLLACLGDSSTDVREATSDAAKVIMGKISGHAVKLILPVLLETLDDKREYFRSWCRWAAAYFLSQNGGPKRARSSSWAIWPTSHLVSCRSRCQRYCHPSLPL